MSEPIDHQIVQGIADCLRQIRQDNGYRSDIGLQVLPNDGSAIDEELPFVEIIDDEEVAEYQNGKRRRASLALTIAVEFPAGDVDQAQLLQARRAFADIRQALATIDPVNWIVGVGGLELGGRTMFADDGGTPFFRPELKARVTFHENHRSNT
ncbi:hypothetical protein D0B54_02390 [Solimonas sp. K1W22B-7]|uniref:hypothetical protein n=1 Tax=Solimonas sp. K1W22B-7 TaxID=2303331 RepID=UPI000E32E172|nr:hypothetical protein [Solimonas sp. K1W22B-7]AXQ27590.1 hypothetical protein D0B54_02390 [Solimonas sp. K1W22B-7]